ncbi:C-terminal binding protein [Candidatus Bathyarchaeota archaeon]|nr:C-terminal binding protein [Candidatus Bathyarchaeota archaeon]
MISAMNTDKIRVTIVDNPFDDISIEKEALKEINPEIKSFRCNEENEISNVARDADIIISNLLPLGRKTLLSLKNLRLIVRLAVGYDNIDLKTATKRRIVVCNIPDYCTVEVTEHTLSLIFTLARRIPQIDFYTKKGKANFRTDWKRFGPIYRLSGKTAGIIGFGRIGREVAEKLKSLGLRILAYDPYLPDEIFKDYGVMRTDLDSLLKNSDIISIHCPLTKETHHLIDKKRLNLMKKTAMLINVSRGAIVDEKALYEALQNNIIHAAALDVFEKEPLDKNSRFLSLKNVIITPHIAWYSEESIVTVRKMACEEIVRFSKGIKPKYVVNKEVLRYYPKLKEI